MSDILRQVDEDLRKERLSFLWRKYGLYLVLASIIAIVTVVGYQFKVYSDKSNNEKLVEIFINASNGQEIEQQIFLFNELTETKNTYLSGISEIKIANLQIENGNIEEGLFQLEKVISNNNYDPIINDLATYQLLMLKIDNLSEDELMNYLTNQKLNESEFRFLFKELLSIKKMFLGKNEESSIGFQELIDSSETPLDIKTRAKKFIEIVN